MNPIQRCPHSPRDSGRVIGRLRPSTVAVLCVAATLSCQSPFTTPPDPEALAAWSRLESFPVPARWTAEVEWHGATMSGLYRSTKIVAGGAAPSVRMQWHGGIGEKVLDLAAGPAAFSGYIPPAAVGLRAAWNDPPPRHLLAFLACSLVESAAPLGHARVLASRSVEEGWELELAPRVPGLRSRVEIGRDGALRARHFRWRGVRWSERFDPHRFEGRGFVLILRDEVSAPLDAAPAAELFQLELPAGTRP